MLLSQLAKIVDGTLFGADVEFTVVGIDSRTLLPDSLFIALRGPHFDAHDFVSAAQQKGAVALLVESKQSIACPQVVVNSTQLALSTYAHWHRRQYNPTVIAVTGSCGKTTTRALLENIFCQVGSVLATQGNYNNEIGVPLMLLQLRSQHDIMILELGASHRGEIAQLAELVQPHVAIITNAAAAHIEGFGSIEEVAIAKGELFQALEASGIAVMNADDDYYDYWRDLSQSKTISFGQSGSADVRAVLCKESDSSFILCLPNETQQKINLKLLGEHNINNALAAAAAAQCMGLGAEVIQKGLEATEPVAGRLVEMCGIHGAQIIDDTYNANPFSVKAAIEMLSKREGRKILVFGDMHELGEQTAAWHFDVGAQAKLRGIKLLYAYGKSALKSVEAFGESAFHFSDQNSLVAALKKELTAETVVLIKGSNSMRMNQIVTALLPSAR